MKKPWDFEEPSCAEVGVSLFFQPDPDDPEQSVFADRNYEYARKVCSTCPHKIECAEWGIANEAHGMWGGLSPRERTAIRKRGPISVQISGLSRYN
jgi:WhiB family redox-sensing transcriptional regulator